MAISPDAALGRAGNAGADRSPLALEDLRKEVVGIRCKVPVLNGPPRQATPR